VVLVLLIAASALVFRLQQLELRPMHGDEAVQAVKAGELYDSGQYRYNPDEFHGPSLYYFTLPVLRLSGARSFAEAGDAGFRLVPVLFGAGLILLLLPLRRDLGGVTVVSAAVLLAISPAMVFFSRYYIQEMLLVFFAALAGGALWRYFHSSRTRWVFWLGAALGLMYATKETSVIFAGAMAVAYGVIVLHRRHREEQSLWQSQRRPIYQLLLALAVAGVVAILFYSSFLANPCGPIDSLLAFRHYFDRSGGDGSSAFHQQPWYYYLKILAYTKDAPGPWWSEGLILALAAVGIGSSFRRRLPAAINPDLAFFLAVYTLILTVVFSLIPYKTPWNLLGFLHGLILMAGIGVASIIHRLPGLRTRALFTVVLLLGAAQLAAQSVRTNFRFCADPRNPYVYAHSVPDVLRLSRRIRELGALHPAGPSMRVHFITPDYWPMPYYLRGFRQIGYWNEVPAAPDAPVIVTNPDIMEQLDPRLRDRYHTEYFGLRPGVLLVLMVQQDLWDRYLLTKL
jgi:uncharacterized protein (TIGR03663 family)